MSGMAMGMGEIDAGGWGAGGFRGAAGGLGA